MQRAAMLNKRKTQQGFISSFEINKEKYNRVLEPISTMIDEIYTYERKGSHPA